MDTIADFLTLIRNGIQARQREIHSPYSRVKYEIARILLEEGYISNFRLEGEGYRRTVVVALKYDEDGVSVVRGLERVSRQSRRVYVGSENLPKVIGGLGVAILTTSRGIMTDRDARRERVGGEVVCKVW